MCISHSLDIAAGGHRVDHTQSQALVGRDDVQSAHRFRHVRVVLLRLINHVQRNGQLAFRIGNDRVRELAGNVQAIGLDVLNSIQMAMNALRSILHLTQNYQFHACLE